ncbi:hypothetical protein B0G93_11878 [Bacillus sp. V-88]|nr:hypothetical protein B0G93_11878 [Bacillus sp. V-88]SLK24035.1 hypothetical protein SAMN06295884_11878 [Bacillus sp. V-88]
MVVKVPKEYDFRIVRLEEIRDRIRENKRGIYKRKLVRNTKCLSYDTRFCNITYFKINKTKTDKIILMFVFNLLMI